MRKTGKRLALLLVGMFAVTLMPLDAIAGEDLNIYTGYREFIPATDEKIYTVDEFKAIETKEDNTDNDKAFNKEAVNQGNETNEKNETTNDELNMHESILEDEEELEDTEEKIIEDNQPIQITTSEEETSSTNMTKNYGNVTMHTGDQHYMSHNSIVVTSGIPNTTMAKDATKYNLVYNAETDKTRFYNFVDGYSVNLPGNIEITNMNLSGLCAVLTDGDRRIEIYREDFNNYGEVQSYLSYSYKGVDSSTVDEKLLKTNMTINGHNVQIYKWHRQPLKGIMNDATYYTSLDIVDGNTIYNIFIKTQTPIEDAGGYMDILNSFAVGPRQQLGTVQIIQHETRHSWNKETEEFYQENFSNMNDMKWGIFEPSAPNNMDSLKRKEAELNFTFPVLLYYSHIHYNYEDYSINSVLEKAYDEGRTLELTLQTNSDNELAEGNMVYQVLNGNYDVFLHKYAAAIADFGHPVMFRLGNEMNGDWCPYSAYFTSRDTAIYRAFYRYIYEVFRSEGALKNTIWIWNPNEKSFPNYKWNYETLYYPGDEYVDVIGITGYNTGTYYSSSGETWRSFDEIYNPIYNKVISYTSKPIMITEFACSSIGGDKAEWVIDMFNNLYKYPRIKMAVWWDGRDLAANGDEARPYYINDNAGAAMAFRAGFNGGVTEYGLVLY